MVAVAAHLLTILSVYIVACFAHISRHAVAYV